MKAKHFLAALLSSATVLGTMSVPALAEGDVAVIGGTGYETLGAAIAAVQSGETVKLVADITESSFSGDYIAISSGKNFTLDLNGHTLFGATAATTDTNLIKNEGTLTITDSSNEGNGTIVSRATNPDASGNLRYVNNAISNYGRLTINGGTVKTADLQSNGKEQAQFAVDNYAGSTFILNDGTVTTELSNNYAVRAYGRDTTTNNKVNIEINGGTISGRDGLKLHCPDKDVNSYIDVNISGGNITADRSIYANYQNNAYDGGYLVGTMNISGGTINNLTFRPSNKGETSLNIRGKAILYAVSAYRTNVNISGGSISTMTTKENNLSISGGTISGWVKDGANTSESITGGTFINKEMQKDLKPGYAEVVDTVVPASTDDDTYMVIRFKDFKKHLRDSVTIKTATENGKYEQVTTATVEIGEINSGKQFEVLAYDDNGSSIPAISGKTITLKDISVTNTSGDGSVICGLIITDIPAGYTVRLE